MTKYSFADMKKGLKKQNNIYNVIYLEHVALRFLWFIANFTPLTPNQLSFIGFGVTIASAYCFGTGYWLLGVLFFELGRLFDAVDGKLARLKGMYSKFGEFLDSSIDTIKIFIVMVPLVLYAYTQTGQILTIVLGLAYTNIICFSQIFYAVGYKVNKNKQLMTIINQKSKLSRFKAFLAKKRLRLAYTSDETNTIAFIIGPLLVFATNQFIYLDYALIAANGFMILLIGLFLFLQTKQLLKADKDDKK